MQRIWPEPQLSMGGVITDGERFLKATKMSEFAFPELLQDLHHASSCNNASCCLWPKRVCALQITVREL